MIMSTQVIQHLIQIYICWIELKNLYVILVFYLFVRMISCCVSGLVKWYTVHFQLVLVKQSNICNIYNCEEWCLEIFPRSADVILYV